MLCSCDVYLIPVTVAGLVGYGHFWVRLEIHGRTLHEKDFIFDLIL